MRVQDLSPEQLARIGRHRYDRIVEKHEGPWDWAGVFRYEDPEFLEVAGRDVLVPVGRDHHAKITVLRVIPSQDGEVLTLFLRDTTHASGIDSGFLAICERVSGEPWFVATVYHEWFVTEDVSDEIGRPAGT